jgi:hypothetical protein
MELLAAPERGGGTHGQVSIQIVNAGHEDDYIVGIACEAGGVDPAGIITRSKFQAIAVDIAAVIGISRAVSQVMLLGGGVGATVCSAGDPCARGIAIGWIRGGRVTLGYGSYGSCGLRHFTGRLGGSGNAGVGVGGQRRGALPLRMGSVVHDVIRAT